MIDLGLCILFRGKLAVDFNPNFKLRSVIVVFWQTRWVCRYDLHSGVLSQVWLKLSRLERSCIWKFTKALWCRNMLCYHGTLFKWLGRNLDHLRLGLEQLGSFWVEKGFLLDFDCYVANVTGVARSQRVYIRVQDALHFHLFIVLLLIIWVTFTSAQVFSLPLRLRWNGATHSLVNLMNGFSFRVARMLRSIGLQWIVHFCDLY